MTAIERYDDEHHWNAVQDTAAAKSVLRANAVSCLLAVLQSPLLHDRGDPHRLQRCGLQETIASKLHCSRSSRDRQRFCWRSASRGMRRRFVGGLQCPIHVDFRDEQLSVVRRCCVGCNCWAVLGHRLACAAATARQSDCNDAASGSAKERKPNAASKALSHTSPARPKYTHEQAHKTLCKSRTLQRA